MNNRSQQGIAVCALLLLLLSINFFASSYEGQLADGAGTLVSMTRMLLNIKNSAAVIDMSGTQLISNKTFSKDSVTFENTQPSDHLWDGCTVGTPTCTTSAPDMESFFVEFDFGAVYNLQSARLFGDVDGATISNAWSLEYKKESFDPWKNAFAKRDAFANGWLEEALTEVAARFVRVTVFGSRVTASGTQARELEVYGTLAQTLIPAAATSTTAAPLAAPTTPPTQPISTGNTYFVAPQGNDSALGTFVEPWKTMQRGADMARAGDTVMVRGGTYIDGFTVRYSGTRGAPITFRNFQGEHPILDLGVTNALNTPKRIELQAAAGAAAPISWVIIEGFEINNGYEGIRFYNATDVVIRNNSMNDTFYSGIEGTGGLRVTITGNKMQRIGLKDLANKASDDKHHGMHLTGSDYLIANNIIDDVRAYGIYFAGYPFSAFKYSDEKYSGVRNALVANNVIANSRFHAGIALWENTAGVQIKNNVFYQNARNLSVGDQAGIDFLYANGGHTISNNIFYHPSKLDTSPGSSGLFTSEKNSTVDPKFVNAAASDFHLQQSSPAIDTGIALPSVAVDFEKNARPQGCCLDIGAYEYGAVTVAPLVPPLAPLPLTTPIVSPALLPPPPPPNGLPAFSIGSYVKIAPPYSVRVRSLPSLQGNILGREKPDAVGVIDSAPVEADGHTWYKIKFQTDTIGGWTSQQYLVYLRAPSNIFSVHSSVRTIQKVNIRSTAGGLKIGAQAQDSTGTVLAGPLHRPFAGAQWWWKIDYATGTDGWTSGDFIVAK